MYKWTDGRGIVQFTEGPDKIPEGYRSIIGKLNQTSFPYPLYGTENIKEDLKNSINQKPNRMVELLNVYQEKSKNNLVYVIGLLIILLIILKIFLEAKPAGIEVNRSSVQKKGTVNFKIYYIDHSSSPPVYLGRILERRKSERGDNFKSLLYKARKDFSYYVKDPTLIFISES